ncbi:MAG: DUF1566 domain-containing protein [Deltaproteobacteria bacterium]|nr:DUF1566 domain-containing protein [Deltaproteobacteria bacterium]
MNARPSGLILAILTCSSLLGWFGRMRDPPPPVRAPAKAVANRFVVLDGGAIVLDRLTGLRWQVELWGTPMVLQDAIEWCKNNKSALSGTGWRLPTITELHTLIDRQQKAPAIDGVFVAAPPHPFWTSWNLNTYLVDGWPISNTAIPPKTTNLTHFVSAAFVRAHPQR